METRVKLNNKMNFFAKFGKSKSKFFNGYKVQIFWFTDTVICQIECKSEEFSAQRQKT